MLKLRNDWKHVGNDRWDWKVYITSDDPSELARVQKVKYILHPTFRNPVRVVKKRGGGFPLSSNGWGTFIIRAFVYFTDGSSVKLIHELELHRNPESGTSS